MKTSLNSNNFFEERKIIQKAFEERDAQEDQKSDLTKQLEKIKDLLEDLEIAYGILEAEHEIYN